MLVGDGVVQVDIMNKKVKSCSSLLFILYEDLTELFVRKHAYEVAALVLGVVNNPEIEAAVLTMLSNRIWFLCKSLVGLLKSTFVLRACMLAGGYDDVADEVQRISNRMFETPKQSLLKLGGHGFFVTNHDLPGCHLL